MEIVEAAIFDDALLTDVRRLLPQLSQSSGLPSEELLRAIVDSRSSKLLLARDGGEVLGMLTLAVFPIPSGIRAWIEDVVVDERGRGKGVGEALNLHALRLAQEAGARTVELTSRPGRLTANRLYQRIGFVRRDTNVYRYSFD